MNPMIQLFLVILISPLVQGLILITDAQPTSFAQWSPLGNKVSYLQKHALTRAIYRIDADGSNVLNLTNNLPGEYPVWSPDGSKFAYSRAELYPNYSLNIMNADGSQNRNLIERPIGSMLVAWSPNSSRLIVWGVNEVFLINVDGSNFSQLASGNDVGYAYHWSPDGTKIVFVNHSRTAIWVMNSDGSDARELYAHPEIRYQLAWSPDGSKLAFDYGTSPYIDENGEIGVINADGSGFIALTNSVSSFRGEFAWSPDSSRIAFAHDLEIYVINADGTQQRNITNSTDSEWMPVWSPDGSKIAFVTNRQEQVEIYSMGANGENPTRLTNNTLEELNFDWSPDGKHIIFEGYSSPYTSLYVVGSNGGNATNLSENLDVSTYAWSHDGAMMAFLKHDLERRDLYVVNIDGSNSHRIAASVSIDSFAWSPTSQQLAIYVVGQGIYVVDAAATELTAATKITTQQIESDLLWSPDGSQLAFLVNGNIHVIDANGSNLTLLTTNGGYSLPTWSPSGDSLAAFRSNETGIEIYLITVGGSATKLTNAVGLLTSLLTWSPDGNKIAYSTGGFGIIVPPLSTMQAATAPDAPLPSPTPTYTTYVINTDGSNRVTLSNNSGWVQWSPDSRRLLLWESGNMFMVDADGQNRILLDTAGNNNPLWGPDGRHILYFRIREPATVPVATDLYVMRVNIPS